MDDAIGEKGDVEVRGIYGLGDHVVGAHVTLRIGQCEVDERESGVEVLDHALGVGLHAFLDDLGRLLHEGLFLYCLLCTINPTWNEESKGSHTATAQHEYEKDDADDQAELRLLLRRLRVLTGNRRHRRAGWRCLG